MASAWRKAFPNTYADWMAFTFTVFMVNFICLFELIVILPTIDGDMGLAFWMHFIIGVCLYLNVAISFVWCVVTDTTSGNRIMPSVLHPGWRFCSACEANSPPRSFHCGMCRICVLRRDHHCFFTGKCVGHSNQRYFMLLVLWLFIGSMYCNFLNVDYTWQVLGGLTLKSLITMIVPLISWLFGLSEVFTFTVSFVSASCLIGFFLLAGFMGYHANNIIRGQTTFENSHRIKDYDCGWQENVRLVFGRNWYYSWLSPLIPSPLECDGVTFKSRNRYENVKDM